MEEGHVVVDSIETIARSDITDALARESGFADAEDLLHTANHGPGQVVYLIRFHYLPPGAWEAAPDAARRHDDPKALLERIHSSKPPMLKPERPGKRRR